MRLESIPVECELIRLSIRLRRPIIVTKPPKMNRKKAVQIHDRYLVAESSDGLMIIDQHALHERVLYETTKGADRRGQT